VYYYKQIYQLKLKLKTGKSSKQKKMIIVAAYVRYKYCIGGIEKGEQFL